MRGVPAIVFIVFIPALVALGHDAWLFSQNQDRGFDFSSMGWIWTHYHLDSYKWTVENVSPETWAIINLALSWKAFFTGLGIAAFFLFFFFLMKFFNAGPLAGEKSSGSLGSTRAQRGKPGKFKYNRK